MMTQKCTLYSHEKARAMGKDVCTPVTVEWIASNSNHGLKSARGLLHLTFIQSHLAFCKKLISADIIFI